MNDDDIEILRDIKPYYLQYKKTLTFAPPHYIQSRVNELHRRLHGNYIEPCGSCWINSLTSLLIESGLGLE